MDRNGIAFNWDSSTVTKKRKRNHRSQKKGTIVFKY